MIEALVRRVNQTREWFGGSSLGTSWPLRSRFAVQNGNPAVLSSVSHPGPRLRAASLCKERQSLPFCHSGLILGLA